MYAAVCIRSSGSLDLLCFQYELGWHACHYDPLSQQRQQRSLPGLGADLTDVMNMPFSFFQHVAENRSKPVTAPH
jgi:hypothetical protein